MRAIIEEIDDVNNFLPLSDYDTNRALFNDLEYIVYNVSHTFDARLAIEN